MKLNIQRFASTNKTANYDLSQYVGSDKPTYLGDYNSDMQKIDAQMKANANNSDIAKTDADLALANAETAQETANNANENANTANETANNALQLATENQASIVEVNNKIETLSTYNENEIDTGKKWINGKTIYRKIIIKSNIDIRNNVTIAHNIENVDVVVNNTIIFKDGQNNPRYMINTICDNSGYIGAEIDRTNIKIIGTTYWQPTTTRVWYFVIEYTKGV